MPINPTHSIEPHACLRTARDALRSITEPAETIRSTLIAVQEILKTAVQVDDIPSAFPDLAKSISPLLFAACPLVSAAGAGCIAPEQVYFGLGRVNDLVTLGRGPERGFALNHSFILASELTIALHRGHLIRHGRESMGGALATMAARHAAEALH